MLGSHLRRILLAILTLFAAPSAGAGELSAPDALVQAKAGTVILVDLRTPGEWAQTGIAPGASRADFNAGPDAFLADIQRITGGDKSRPLALICRSGNRSARAAALLQRNGFTSISDVSEGMNGWLGRGLPTVPVQ